MDTPDLWTLDQLTEQVEAALAVGYSGAPSGRVRSVPDRRAIRWYTTIGLVDRPASMRGRTALYDERHLLQLVAIKRRQAEGRTLAEIQTELAGATDATLRAIAQLPNGAEAPRTIAAPRADRFWSAARATAEPAGASVAATPPADTPAATPPTDPLAAAPPAGRLTAAPPADVAVDVAPEVLGVAADEPATYTPPSYGHSYVARTVAPDVARKVAPDVARKVAPDVARKVARRVAPDVAPDVAPKAAPDLAADVAPGVATDVTVVPAVTLPGGVTLLLPAGAHYPTADDLHAIRTAAVPLLAELARRWVIDTDPTEGTP